MVASVVVDTIASHIEHREMPPRPKRVCTRTLEARS